MAGVYLLATSWTSNIPAWVTLAIVIAGAWSFLRGGGGTAIASLEVANRALEKRVHELETQARDKDKEIAELRGRTDVSIAMRPILEMASKHELHAQERHEKTLIVLDLIAQRLGTDPERSH